MEKESDTCGYSRVPLVYVRWYHTEAPGGRGVGGECSTGAVGDLVMEQELARLARRGPEALFWTAKVFRSSRDNVVRGAADRSPMFVRFH